ncbi:MAG: dihydroorotate dehydrogenase electron transfer subunit [Candidatus Omnitrophota bacterium]
MGATDKKIKAIVISNRKICDKHYLLEIKDDILGKKSVPGQFVNVLVDTRATDPLLRIPLGVHRIQRQGISLFYKVAGKATEMLSEKEQGEKVDALGPLGNGFNLRDSSASKNKQHILVAGGHGAAPLYALAEQLLKAKDEVLVFIGASSKKCVVLADHFRKLGCKVGVSTDDGTAGTKGYVTCLLKDFLSKRDAAKTSDIYACGPRPMLSQISRIAASAAIRAQVSVDPYMACGTGICRGCAVLTTAGYKLACKDGPVFYSDEIVWEKDKGCSS